MLTVFTSQSLTLRQINYRLARFGVASGLTKN
jgi:hypothetical protein